MYILRSTDQGRTWSDRSPVCLWGSEAGMLCTRSGRLLIAVRFQRTEAEWRILPSDPVEMADIYTVSGYRQVYLAHSDDQGHTWKQWQT